MLVLEWSDPPFNAGHWVPDQVEAAGGVPVLAAAGARSRRLTWEEIAAEQVDVTVFMPCGFDLAGAVAQAPALLARPEADGLGRIVAVDANAYFSRPGPRVVEGVELLEAVLHGPSGSEVLRCAGPSSLTPLRTPCRRRSVVGFGSRRTCAKIRTRVSSVLGGQLGEAGRRAGPGSRRPVCASAAPSGVATTSFTRRSVG